MKIEYPIPDIPVSDPINAQEIEEIAQELLTRFPNRSRSSVIEEILSFY